MAIGQEPHDRREHPIVALVFPFSSFFCSFFNSRWSKYPLPVGARTEYGVEPNNHPTRGDCILPASDCR